MHVKYESDDSKLYNDEKKKIILRMKKMELLFQFNFKKKRIFKEKMFYYEFLSEMINMCKLLCFHYLHNCETTMP